MSRTTSAYGKTHIFTSCTAARSGTGNGQVLHNAYRYRYACWLQALPAIYRYRSSTGYSVEQRQPATISIPASLTPINFVIAVLYCFEE